VIFLELDELLHVAERTLGHAPHVRDHGLLESALARPRATAFGEDAYPRHPPQGSRVAAFAGAQPRAGRRAQRAPPAILGMPRLPSAGVPKPLTIMVRRREVRPDAPGGFAPARR
jgi:hypothetical protein